MLSTLHILFHLLNLLTISWYYWLCLFFIYISTYIFIYISWFCSIYLKVLLNNAKVFFLKVLAIYTHKDSKVFNSSHPHNKCAKPFLIFRKGYLIYFGFLWSLEKHSIFLLVYSSFLLKYFSLIYIFNNTYFYNLYCHTHNFIKCLLLNYAGPFLL